MVFFWIDRKKRIAFPVITAESISKNKCKISYRMADLCDGGIYRYGIRRRIVTTQDLTFERPNMKIYNFFYYCTLDNGGIRYNFKRNMKPLPMRKPHSDEIEDLALPLKDLLCENKVLFADWRVNRPRRGPTTDSVFPECYKLNSHFHESAFDPNFEPFVEFKNLRYHHRDENVGLFHQGFKRKNG